MIKNLGRGIVRQLVTATFLATLSLSAYGISETRAQETVTVAKSTTSMLYLPLYVGDVLGYFEEEGLALEITLFKTGGATALAAVLGGNLDIYAGAASSALTAASKGAPARVFASLMTDYSIDLVMRGEVAEELGLSADSTVEERLAALEGRTIGVTGAGSGTHQIIRYALEQANLDPERDVTIAFAGSGPDMVAAFLAGRVDAVTLTNPTSNMLERENGAFVLVRGAGGGYPGLGEILYVAGISTEEWLNENREEAEAFMRVLEKSLAAIADPSMDAEAIEAVRAKYFAESDAELFKAAYEALRPAFPEQPTPNDAQIETVLSFLNKFLDEPVEVDAEAVFVRTVGQ